LRFIFIGDSGVKPIILKFVKNATVKIVASSIFNVEDFLCPRQNENGFQYRFGHVWNLSWMSGRVVLEIHWLSARFWHGSVLLDVAWPLPLPVMPLRPHPSICTQRHTMTCISPPPSSCRSGRRACEVPLREHKRYTHTRRKER